MTTHALVSRRILLRDMGKAGIAVAVLGTAACSGDATGSATPSPRPGSTTSAGTPTSSSGASGSASPGRSTSPAQTGDGHEWHRVDLGFVSAYILYRAGVAAVVDTGVAGSAGPIEAALGVIDLDWDSVAHLVLTHKHPDHQGSVEAVLDACGAQWYAGAGDIAAIRAPSEGIAVSDGDTVFDLRIIETPGHTPGHVSVLDEPAGVLVAGDAINGAAGGVVGPNPDFSEDMELANASVGKLAGFEYETILFGHGEPVLRGGRDAVAALAAG